MFDGIANVYTPFYRQVSYPPVCTMLAEDDFASSHYQLAYRDVVNAFQYYMAHENEGRPIILMENGKIYKKELTRAKIDLNEFLAQARIAGYFDLNEIESAMLETSGQISFLPKSQNRPATPEDLNLDTDPVSTWYDLVMDGQLMPDHLKASGKDRTWLDSQLARADIGQMSEAFYAACDKDGNFFACRGK